MSSSICDLLNLRINTFLFTYPTNIKYLMFELSGFGNGAFGVTGLEIGLFIPSCVFSVSRGLMQHLKIPGLAF